MVTARHSPESLTTQHITILLYTSEMFYKHLYTFILINTFLKLYRLVSLGSFWENHQQLQGLRLPVLRTLGTTGEAQVPALNI